MHRKNLLAVSAFCFICFFATAQKTDTLFYTDGKIAMSGQFRFSSTAVLPLDFRDFSNRERGWGERSRKIMSVPGYNGDYWELNEMLIRMQCEGPVKLWYPDGTPMAEMTFTNGRNNGIYTAYHSNGQKAMQGKLSDGMPEGEWQTFYNNGKLYFNGSFWPYSQQELKARWASTYGLKQDPFYLKKILEDATEEFDTLRNELADLSAGVRYMFVAHVPRSISKKNGHFKVFNENGKLVAEMDFIHNVRHGLWTLYNEDGSMKLSLTYNKGRLIHIQEEQHRKETLLQFCSRKKQEEKVKQQQSISAPIAAEQVYPTVTWVDEAPRFDHNLQQYFQEHVHLDANAKVKELDGQYLIQFRVSSEGRVSGAVMLEGKNKQLNRLIVDAVNQMPAWKPGRHNNVPVSKLCTIRINYGIQVSY